MVPQPNRRFVLPCNSQDSSDLVPLKDRGHPLVGVKQWGDYVRRQVDRGATRAVQIAEDRAKPLRDILH